MVTHTHICLHTQTHKHRFYNSIHTPLQLALPWAITGASRLLIYLQISLYIRSVFPSFPSVLPEHNEKSHPLANLVLCRADKQNNVFVSAVYFP